MAMNQRTASAPWVSINGIGSKMLPRCLLILVAVLGQDVPEADDIAVRVLVEHQGVDRHQRIEPAAGLVDRLADEVGRERLLELLLRAGDMRKPHWANGIEPESNQASITSGTRR